MSEMKHLNDAIIKVGMATTVLAISVASFVLTGPVLAASIGSISAPAQGDQAARPPDVSATVITADDRPEAFAMSAKARNAFGFPQGPSRSGRHVRDSQQSLEYDEIVELDSAGQPLDMTQFDASARLVSAIRFDQPTRASSAADGPAATRRASRGLNDAGIAAAGQPRTEADGFGGWRLHWERVASGLPVRGDEIQVIVRADGQIQSVGQVQHVLAAAPAKQLGAAEARARAKSQTDVWTRKSGTTYSVAQASLQWVGRNSVFDSSKTVAADEPYRMAWVVEVTPTGPGADYVQRVALFVDAGDGSILGGDVVE